MPTSWEVADALEVIAERVPGAWVVLWVDGADWEVIPFADRGSAERFIRSGNGAALGGYGLTRLDGADALGVAHTLVIQATGG